ncbi:MAG: HAMP domain-containing sensor histidine kinase [Minicystis sp.]
MESKHLLGSAVDEASSFAADAAAQEDVDRLIASIHELSRLRDLEGIMAVVRRAARELTGADGVTFVLREGDVVHYAEEDAIAPLWKGRRFPATSCISGWVMINREPAVIEDVYADPRIPADVYRTTFVRSLAMVPVRPPDPVAAIGAYWARPHRATERELKLLLSLAGSTAIALANAELYAEARAAQVAAEAASRAKDDFLAVLSHELRTPLTSILGWATVLRTRTVEAATLARAHEIIERNARLQMRTVEDLLDASLVLANRFSLDLRPTDLGEIAAEACAAAQPAIAGKGLTLTIDREAQSLVVDGDAARLRKVIDSLLANAAKFTPRGGRIEVDVRQTGGRAEVCVRDTGHGIEPDFLPHVFGRFRQEDGGKTRRHGGLGLELALIHHIVKLHGGEIDAESAGRGQGATFTVRLPLVAGTASDTP